MHEDLAGSIYTKGRVGMHLTFVIWSDLFSNDTTVLDSVFSQVSACVSMLTLLTVEDFRSKMQLVNLFFENYKKNIICQKRTRSRA